jgi:HTTM domain
VNGPGHNRGTPANNAPVQRHDREKEVQNGNLGEASQGRLDQLTGYTVMEGARLQRWLGAASSARRWLPRLRFDVGALIEIDLRSLALFRIGVAVTVLIDLASRVRDLDALYGARGVLPPEMARVLWDLRVTVSPFTWVAAWPSLLWTGVALLAIAALCLALGVTPRLAAAVAWGLLAALQDRNMGLVMGGDRFLLLLLMSCILLPTGARLSLRPAPLGATRIRSWAGAGLLLQVMLVYVVTGLKKTGSDWFDGTALWYALSDYEYVTAAGHWLRSQPVLIVPLSFAVKWVEIFGPLLVLSPWRNGTARLTAIGLFWTLHLGLQACQAIGVFQLVGLAAWLAFLPSAIWDRRATREPAGREAPIHAEQGVQPARWSERLALVPIAYLIIVLGYVVTGVLVHGTPSPTPAPIERIARPLHLQQGWAMFSSVPHEQVWILAPGWLADGSEIEVLRRAPVDWSRPWDLQSAQRGFRWTLYLGNVIKKALNDPTLQMTHPVLLEYLCREWNARNEREHRLERVTLVAVTEVIPGPGITSAAPGGRYLIATLTCPPTW